MRGGCTPGKSRDGRTGARAVIGTSTRVRGRGRLLRERNRKGPNKASGADVLCRFDQHERSELPRARIDSGGTPPVRGRTGQAALSPSARAGSCAPGMPPSRLRQGRKRPSETSAADVRQHPAQARPSAAAPRRELTAEALRRCVAARAKPPSRLRQGRGGCTPGMPASCVPQGRKGPSEISGADARRRPDEHER